jgi:WD40 repeat protein
MQYSGECVHVLENDDSMVTACAFSGDSSLLATGISNESKTLVCAYSCQSFFVLWIHSLFCLLKQYDKGPISNLNS